ncbi:MAG: hypothetical protein HZB26_01380 [Candidatus Hydrogenedentes bacterium]|nr:hypothetical protein [Candidatus Hydrogenedentota bacterium]
MFNLNEAVSIWRDSLKDADALSALDVAELEGHLREEAARVEALGLTSEEAFVIASRRIGSPHALNIEYEKADPSQAYRTRMYWIVLGMFGYWALNSLTSTVTTSVFLLGSGGYLPLGTAWAVYLLVWGLGMTVTFRVLVLISRGRLTSITAAIQNRYLRKYKLLVDVLVLAVAVPLAQHACRLLMTMSLYHSGLHNHQFDANLVAFAALVTTVASPMAIGILLYFLYSSRRVSAE